MFKIIKIELVSCYLIVGYLKNKIPYGQAKHNSPLLAVEEAWDVAAYVNAQPRPHANQSKDYPDISKKPVDFPHGPYADKISL